jgi:hypothetical protein
MASPSTKGDPAMRVLTAREDAIREKAKDWLGPLMAHHKLSNSRLAIEILPPGRRAELQGHSLRELIEAAPRKKIAGWRAGKRTPDAHSAFELGEALTRCGIPRERGVSVAFKLGYPVDLARALLNLSSVQGDRLSALALFVAVPLVERESAVEESALLQPAEELLSAAVLVAGSSYDACWKQRDLTQSRLVPILDSLEQFVRDSEDLTESAFQAWGFLVRWAVQLASDLRMDVCAPEESIELGLLSLTLTAVADSTFDAAERRLVTNLLTLLKRKERYP